MPFEDSQDAVLMEALVGGRQDALPTLIERWKGPLLSFIFRYIHEESAAKDLLEETFVRVYQYRNNFWPGSSFSSWLFTIASNLCRNHKRWRHRHPEMPLSPVNPDDESENASGVEAPSEEGDPHRAMARKEFEEALVQALDALSHEQKSAFLLHEYEDLSYEEIAGVLQCSTRKVETHITNARQQLRTSLERFRENLRLPASSTGTIGLPRAAGSALSQGG